MSIQQVKNIVYLTTALLMNGCDSGSEKPSANLDKSSNILQQDCFNNTNTGTDTFGSQTNTGTSTFGTNTGTADGSTFGSNTGNSQSTFGLNQVTYNTHIQPIVSAKCLSCHSINSTVDLTNLTNLPTHQSNMLSVAMGLSSRPEHSNIIFNSTEQNTFQTWAQNGFPLGDGASSFGTGTSGTFGQPNNSGFGSDCGNTQGNTFNQPTTPTTPGINDTEDVMQALINSAIKQECEGKNELVDRDNDQCFSGSQLDMSWCNPDGIKDKFQASANAGAAVETELQSRKSAGYVISQCGMENNKPIVTLYQRDDGQRRLLTAIIRIGS